MAHEIDSLLSEKQTAWRGFTRLLFWGSVVTAILTIIAVGFAL